MLNVECLMLNVRAVHSFNIQHSTFNIPVLLLLLLTGSAFANDLSVDKRTILIDESVTITVTLENEFASLDTIRVPLQNLAFNGLPSVSSEYQWISGASSRRKIFTYSA